MRLLLSLCLLPALSLASFCGENGVPFSLEVLPNGSPVLGCAQPSCIALSEGEDDSIFEADTAGNFDGYFRDEERTSHLQANKFKAKCSGKFDSSTCPKKNQWVGGIDFVSDLKAALTLQCCTFEGLRFSQDVGVTTIAPGEAVTGGEVIREGRQISFDVIANVRKVQDPADSNRILYEVTVRRMNCLPDPGELHVPFAVDADIGEEVQRVLGNDDNRAPLDRPEDVPKAPEAPPAPQEAPELIQEIPEGPPQTGDGEDVVQVQPELPQEIIAPVEEERKEIEANPNRNFFVHKKERQNQPTFGAPTFDPSVEAGATRVHPRFVEERPPSEYSTTQQPPTISTTTTTLPPPTTAEIEPVVTEDVPADYDPETVPAPKIADPAKRKTLKLTGVTTVAPTTHNPFLFPGFQPFPGFPLLPPPPQPLQAPPAPTPAAFAANPLMPLAPLPPPTHHHHQMPAAAAGNPFALPNPFAFPQLPNPWMMPQPQQLQQQAAPAAAAAAAGGAASFNGVFGAPPAPQKAATPKVPGLEEAPTVVEPVVRGPIMHKHASAPGGAAPPAPSPATLAPLLMPPPFPSLFGPFPMQGRK